MIFPLIWRILPGPVVVRLLFVLVLVAALVWCCFTWVFPWLADSVLPAPDATLEQ